MSVIRWVGIVAIRGTYVRAAVGLLTIGPAPCYSRWSFRALLLFMLLTALTHSPVNLVSWLFGLYELLRLLILINVANRKGWVKLRGGVEIDEVYQKAKGRNNSLLVRFMRAPRRRWLGRRVFIAARDVKEETVLNIAHSSIEEGSHTYMDNPLQCLDKEYVHGRVDHSKGEYVRGKYT